MPAKKTEINEINNEKQSKKNLAADKKIKSTKKVTTKKATKTSVKRKTATAVKTKTATKKTTTKKTSVKKTITENKRKIKKETVSFLNKDLVKQYDLTEYYDLPAKYEKTIVKILAQTPNTLFIYWDISTEDRKKLTRHVW